MAYYKKMAGTAAVFICSEANKASPVERDGMIWTADELKLDTISSIEPHEKESMANALALEGLEDYDPPENGDMRQVDSLSSTFIFIAQSKAWVQIHRD